MTEREIFEEATKEIRAKTKRLSEAASGDVIIALWNQKTGAVTYTDELQHAEKQIHSGYKVVCAYANGMEMIVLGSCSTGVVHMSMMLYEKIRSM